MIIKGILVMLVFLLFSFLMLRQKISTYLALLAMAILIPAVCLVPLSGDKSILYVLTSGSTKMASSIMALIFGAWLGQIMNETGITRSLIRTATEFGGDRPMVLTLALSAVVALLFTSLSGLGSTIMVGALVLPILTAVGIKPAVAAAAFLFARAVGYNFNLYVWNLFTDVTGLSVDFIKNFGLIVTGISAVLFIAYLIVELKIKKVSVAWCPPAEATPMAASDKKVPLIALLTPLIPFPLVIFLKWDIIPAILAGCIYGALVADPKHCLQVWNKAIHEAIKSAAPAIALMISIGMVVNAVGLPTVSESILAIVGPVIPSSPIMYVLFFVILAPLALYRGPLNMFGLGSGVIAVFVATGSLPAAAIMAAFFATQVIQQAGDPTNSQNVWTADFVGIEVNEITTRLLPYLWIAAALCIAAGAFMYF